MTTLAASRLTSHSQGPLSVSSKSFTSKTCLRSGEAKTPKLLRCASPQRCAWTPVSGIRAQLCGEAHRSNFGVFASPERRQVFDVNDFDETLVGPWEWDVKRLAASVVIAGRQNGYTAKESRQAVLRCVQSYREHMQQFALMNHLDVILLANWSGEKCEILERNVKYIQLGGN